MAWLFSSTVAIHSAEQRAHNRQPQVTAQTFYAMALGGLGATGTALWVNLVPTAAVLVFALGLGGATLAFIARPRLRQAN